MTSTLSETRSSQWTEKPATVRTVAHIALVLLALAALRLDFLWMWLANRGNWASWGFSPGGAGAWGDAFYYLRSHLQWMAFAASLGSMLFAAQLFRAERGRLRWFTLGFALAIFVFITVARFRTLT
jgi:hypothetical protein